MNERRRRTRSRAKLNNFKTYPSCLTRNLRESEDIVFYASVNHILLTIRMLQGNKVFLRLLFRVFQNSKSVPITSKAIKFSLRYHYFMKLTAMDRKFDWTLFSLQDGFMMNFRYLNTL